MHGFVPEMRRRCILPLCRESVTGMPRIEIEFEFHMVSYFGIRLAPCAFSIARIYLLHIVRPVGSDRPTNIVFVRPSVHECKVITLQPLGIDLCNFKERSWKDISHQDHVE